MVLCILLFAASFIKIGLFGYYDAIGIAFVVIYRVLFMLMKISLILMISRWSLKLRLKTQVLKQGRVFLLAYDEF